jgi:hypothetical protein
MEQEQNEGVAYLMALKQSRSSQSSADAPGQETLPEAESELIPAGHDDRFQGAEKRRAPRYRCEGSAEMRAEGCDVRTWATFTDISLHGCYVEAQATYPAGSILHMKLDANSIRVETQGCVRVNYPYLGMGIAFVDMSDENRARLKQLLATISRPSVIMGPGIASSLPATEPLGAVPLISNPQAAVEALVEFFESCQMLMRDDFLRILRKSQNPELRP